MSNVQSMQKLANSVSGKTVAKIMLRMFMAQGGSISSLMMARCLELFLVPGESEILWCVSPKEDVPRIEIEFNDQFDCHHV